MMECGWGSPEAIANCIHLGTRWFQIIVNLVGLGTFALIALLIGLFRRLRKDLKKWEDKTSHEKERRHDAEQSTKQAIHRSTLAEAQAVRDRKALEDIRATVEASEDELRKKVAITHTQLEKATAKVSGALELTMGGTEKFWSRPVAIGTRFDEYERAIGASIPILLFGNQKGGVGKSTLVTNLAAAFAKKGERVLTVDLDYQGSHSSLMQLQIGQGDQEPESLIDYLFQDDLDSNWHKITIKQVCEKLHYIPAFYSFEQIERRVEYQWALGTTKDDVRYRLAKALLSQEIKDRYDRILIDAPPRFTLGFVNGFCAATHLYVPTVVDRLSTSAVSAFARQFSELKPIVNHRIEWAGIVGTMTFANTKTPLILPQNAAIYADEAEHAAQSRLATQQPLFIREPVIKRDAALARATVNGIAYLNDSSVRPMFDALVSVIESKAPSRKT